MAFECPLAGCARNADDAQCYQDVEARQRQDQRHWGGTMILRMERRT
ncbi:hypothetical protein ACFLVN_00015 [Chloroflexota bacterium]